jgi:hypothetical protein
LELIVSCAGSRRRRSWRFRNAALFLLMNATATGRGGTRNYDLGRPHFLSTGSGGVPVAVAPEMAGQACVANGLNYRPGTLSAQAFLGQFVTRVPEMAVLRGTCLKDFQAGFDAAHRAVTYAKLSPTVRVLHAATDCCCWPLAAAVAVTVAISRSWH